MNYNRLTNYLKITRPIAPGSSTTRLFSHGMLQKVLMKYRSRNDIVSQILEAANGGAAKTKIMYKAYLSYTQLKEYLAVLDKNDLLEYDQVKNLYRTTNKGLEYMKMYDQMGSLVAPDQVIRE